MNTRTAEALRNSLRVDAERAVLQAARTVADYLPGHASFDKRYGALRRAVDRLDAIERS